ncbi:MAG: acyl-CoA thioesterase [Bacteroidetes bacterium GWE2_29_8]|nr:MAG: acyl-CoA thioesterase [Bacteroidetes bacterium GWE2_29_8]OFY14779.1 MAG: acyl-CoA thioesterase [Bacteroidetes bacterium GWF2_29_10]
MKIKKFNTYRLVKGEDLNHHGTLFAGRSAEWFVESGFIAASSSLNPKNLICLKIHGMHFTKPVNPGEVICFEAKHVYVGRSSIITYIKVFSEKQPEYVLVDGFITFVHVDENTNPCPHNITLEIENEYDFSLNKKASELLKK